MNNKQTRALVALGSNMPHGRLQRAALLSRALEAIEAAGLPVMAASSAWESAAWPDPSQPAFVNAVAAIDAGDRDPMELFAVLRDVERAFGRERRERWGPRTLDLDIIDLGGLTGDYSGILLPHPRAHERAFVLGPLAEVAPDWRHPALGRSAMDLLSDLPADPTLRRQAPLR